MSRRLILLHHVLGSVPFSRIANAGFTIGGEDGPFSSWSSEEALSDDDEEAELGKRFYGITFLVERGSKNDGFFGRRRHQSKGQRNEVELQQPLAGQDGCAGRLRRFVSIHLLVFVRRSKCSSIQLSTR